ncbi:metal-dependent hydrolase [Marinomonas agarivorans]|nr:metal-dependent hydrolase [Marinomonas agarivorans]
MTHSDPFTHPMDNIEVRPLRFDYTKIEMQDPVWSRSNPLFSIYINALGIHVPYFERFLVMAFRAVRDNIDNEILRKDVTSIIGQEAHHGRNFIEFNKFLMQRYPEVEALDQRAKTYFETRLQKDSQKQKIGYIAGYETFTYLGGMIILEGYDKWMKEADPVTRSLWLWHQVEEVEHGAVAFDVYQYFYAGNEWYRKWMIVKSLSHIAYETWLAYFPMCKKEGYFSSPFKAAKAIGFYVNFSYQLAKNALPVFSKKYHPRTHQEHSFKQNEIAVGWRKAYSKGEDLRDLNNHAVEKLS